jgi:type IV pilus assembly protein PilB
MTDVARSRIGVTTYLVPSGPLQDQGRIEALREALDAALGARELQVVVDLADVPTASSEGLEALLAAQESLARAGGALRIANANAVLRDVFRLTGIADQIALADLEPSGPEIGGAAPGRTRRIGEILVQRGLTDEATIERALALQARTGRRMAQIMVEEGWLSERNLLEALSEQLGIACVRLRQGIYDPRAVRLIDGAIARRLGVLCLFRIRDTIYLATADPQSLPSIATVEDLTGCRVRPVLACGDEITKTIEEAYGEARDLSEYVGSLENDVELVETRVPADEATIDELAAASPVINLINGLIQRAIQEGASDIHIEPSRTVCRVRLRVDGVLHPLMAPPLDVHPALVSRLKVMARLDIAERRLPQDGRIQVVTRSRTVDLRFSSLPGIYGEKVVLRVLDKSQAVLDLERLGLSTGNAKRFRELLARSHGLLLVTGPTGSGKTTTLYAAVRHLNSAERNIVTIEDPVEYQIDTINQNQVNDAIGLSFPKFLKHVLRQDPDVIMLGEIREQQTAEIAVQAALTGHLVLSTLHTNDSIGAITRLIDMGVEPFLLSSALIGVMAQRLVRSVCMKCKTTFTAPPDAMASHGIELPPMQRLVRGRGCSSCFDSGYKGRVAIHEILASDAALQRLIVSNPARDELDGFVRERKIETLVHHGVERAIAGETTLEEVLRVVAA